MQEDSQGKNRPISNIAVTITRTIKCSLERFCKDKDLLNQIRERCIQINQLKVEAMHLMGLDIRYRYEQFICDSSSFIITNSSEELPWTKERVEKFIKTVSYCKGARVSIPPELLSI